MAALVGDFVALLFQRQTIDFHYVVQHAGEDANDFTVLLIVEAGLVGERVVHEHGQVHRAQQAAAVRGQGLFATGVGGADVFAEPVVVHLVDLVDQDEPWLGVVVGAGHDGVPDELGFQGAVDAARNLAFAIDHVTLLDREVAVHELGFVGQVQAFVFHFFFSDGERQVPVVAVAHGFDEVFGDQQRQVELAQAAVFTLGLDEVDDVRVVYVEGGHLRATAATGGRHGEAHAVEDIHERQRAGGGGTRTGNVGAAGAQGGEFITNTTTGFEGEAGFVVFFQDVVHGVLNGARHGAVDGGRGWFVGFRTGVGGNAASGDGTVAQGPDEFFLVLGTVGFVFHFGKGSGNTLVGCFDVLIDGFAGLGFELVLAVPDVQRSFLHWNCCYHCLCFSVHCHPRMSGMSFDGRCKPQPAIPHVSLRCLSLEGRYASDPVKH